VRTVVMITVLAVISMGAATVMVFPLAGARRRWISAFLIRKRGDAASESKHAEDHDREPLPHGRTPS